jgi:NAD(P)-dependent dehydrogenase (short-subunit alcohol dehydrogenase family)
MSAADRRITVVTGASRGIGRAAALALGAAGHQVVLVARAQKALEALDDEIRAAGGAATLVPMDLKDEGGIERLAGALFERYGRIDGLLAAAGVLGDLSPVNSITPRAWSQNLEINLTANWRLIRSLEPLLRASPSGRAVFVSSGIVDRPRAFWAHYAASKAGLDALVRCWADEVENTAIRVNLINPGPMRTKMRSTIFPGEDPMSLPPPEAMAPLLADMLSSGWTDHAGRVVFRETAGFAAWERDPAGFEARLARPEPSSSPVS